MPSGAEPSAIRPSHESADGAAFPYPHLASPIRVGPFTVKNRVVFPPHLTCYTRNYRPTDRYIAYLEERAKGGVGWIVAEAATVHRSGSWEFLDFHFRGWDPEIVPHYRRMTDVLHRYGVVVTQNLSHGGRNVSSAQTFRPAWAPSPVRPAGGGDLPKEMDLDDIAELKAGFVQSAWHAREGGLDGIDLQITSDYLLNSFLVPALNRRTDAYGGSFQNRMRLILEILEAIRERCGTDFGVGVRCAGGLPEFTGFTDDEFVAVYRELDRSGLIDWISVHAGSYFNAAATVPPMELPKANAVALAELLKANVRVPVVVAGRIDTPELAESIIGEGKADLVGIMRALLADAEWPRKAFSGEAERIRPCLYCNQGCQPQAPLTCVQNPAVGQEASLGIGTLRRTDTPRRVVVVGGGVAGMEAARVAAERGHRVELFEAADQLGGQVRLATRVPHRAELGQAVSYLEREIARLGVPVTLGTWLEADDVLALNPDAIIVATGATPDRQGSYATRPDLTEIPGAALPHVITAWDALSQPKLVRGRSVFILEDGHHEGFSTLYWLAEQGCDLVVVTTALAPGVPALQGTREWGILYPPLLRRLNGLHTLTQVIRIEEGSVRIRHNITGEEQSLAADTVILSFGSRPDDRLYRALRGRHPEVRAVGDCVSPRKLGLAIYEGHVAGRAV